jgi:putative membrane protein
MTQASQLEQNSEPESALPPGLDASSGRRPGRTRISAVWCGVLAAAVIIVLLLVFILQNTRPVKISFLSASGSMPLGIALSFAALGGVLLAGLVASLRIWQLHLRLTRPVRVTSPMTVASSDEADSDQAA